MTFDLVKEVMYLLSNNWQTQNEFLLDIAQQIYTIISLLPQDFERILELNQRYADLSLIVISERLNISAIVTLDSDFNVYRRYRNKPFNRIFLPE